MQEPVIDVRPKDGFVHAGKLCRFGRCRFFDWFRLPETKALIDSVSRRARMYPIDVLYGIGPAEQQGTWVHPDVALHLAHWISPDLADVLCEVLLIQRHV